MKAKLISRKHGEFIVDEEATIGRSSKCKITVDASVVSGEHARISFDPDREAYALEDLGSLNGTELDGSPVQRKEFLGKLHMIRFGGTEDFVFQLVSADEGTELDTMEIPPVGQTQVDGEVPNLPASLQGDQLPGAAKPGTQVEHGVIRVPEILAEAGSGSTSEKASAKPAAAPPAAPSAAPSGAEASEPRAYALELRSDQGTRRFRLKDGENVVGRSRGADVRVDVRDLSRRHATLIVSGSSVKVRDEDSRNHTFINGEEITEEIAVEVGATIVFGRLEARLVAAPSSGGADTEKFGTQPFKPK